MSASFEVEHPLQGRKTLRGWMPLAPPPLLHCFACDSAERTLCAYEQLGHDIDTRAWKALYTKRRWIEGKQTAADLQGALREMLDVTLTAVDINTGLAWAYLAVAEAIHQDPQEAALKASAKTARSTAILASTPSNIAGMLTPPQPTPLYAPSIPRRTYLLRPTVSILQWKDHPWCRDSLTPTLRAWIFERFWQEDHLSMLIHLLGRQRRKFLSALLHHQESKADAAHTWQGIWQEVLYEA
ncbi:MAG: hypothetical protein H6727_12190 [Myxococcales bacterium]|nr:hypothetical protein [Myxococcales bacterium]